MLFSFKIAIKAAIKTFTMVSGKHMCWNIFFNKAAGLRSTTFLKKTPKQVFYCEYCEIFKNSCFYRTSPVAA